MSNRSLYVDFTIPYTDIGVGMVVPNKNKNMWIFLKPLSVDLWITTAAFFILTGIIVWIIEHPNNEEFQGSLSQQIGTVLWFSFSTLVFAHSKYSLQLPFLYVFATFYMFLCLFWSFITLINEEGKKK